MTRLSLSFLFFSISIFNSKFRGREGSFVRRHARVSNPRKTDEKALGSLDQTDAVED